MSDGHSPFTGKAFTKFLKHGLSLLISTSGTYWLDVAPDNLPKLLAILDTYRRRLLRRIIDRGVVDNLTFFPGHRYTASPYTRTPVASGYYANLPDMTVNVR